MYYITVCVKMFGIFERVVWRISALKCLIKLRILQFPLLPLKFAERKI